MSASKIRVAIIGGGLAGSILMNALSKHSNLDVNVYESSGQFNERGASVGLSGNASRALELMDLKSVLPKAGAVRVNGMRLMMVSYKASLSNLVDIGLNENDVLIHYEQYVG